MFNRLQFSNIMILLPDYQAVSAALLSSFSSHSENASAPLYNKKLLIFELASPSLVWFWSAFQCKKKLETLDKPEINHIATVPKFTILTLSIATAS